jgi:TetR/AcrR family transcriptional regulator
VRGDSARSEPGDDVRSRILDAAEAVFAERGYAAAATREIAERAGIGKRMLFYYFPTKDAVYRATLERIIAALVSIHEAFRREPGPVGLTDAMEGITYFAASSLPAVRILVREIMDDGPLLADLASQHLGPLFERGSAEVVLSMQRGFFRRADPMHVLVNVGGITLFYFLMQPLLERVWERDPLAPATVAERAAAARDFLMHGLAGVAPAPKRTASRKEISR